jgi:transposase
VEAGLSAQRIYQDLVEQNGFTNSYQSVKRFVRKLKVRQPERVWRMECRPGEEVQVDFGLGAPIEDRSGKKRRSWVLRMVLSYSRKAYSEAVTKQDTETFLRCLENGLRSFGGCPLLLNLDNMKSAVLKADWFDPEINPRLADFCRHYGLHVVPCRPAMPQHKGKVERGVAYLRSNALKGRRFGCLAEENLFLEHWESNIADKRIHGTTRKQVGACFAEERPHLQPLAVSFFRACRKASAALLPVILIRTSLLPSVWMSRDFLRSRLSPRSKVPSVIPSSAHFNKFRREMVGGVGKMRTLIPRR